MFFLSLFWLLPKLFRVCALRRPGEEVSLVLAWAMLLVCTLPAALGRCEFGHVAHYEIAVFLTTMIVAAKWAPRLFPIYTILFVMVYGIVGRAVTVAGLSDLLQPVRMTLAGKRPSPDSPPSPLISALRLDEVSAVAGPLGLDGATRRYLIETGRFAPQYHVDYGARWNASRPGEENREPFQGGLRRRAGGGPAAEKHER